MLTQKDEGKYSHRLNTNPMYTDNLEASLSNPSQPDHP